MISAALASLVLTFGGPATVQVEPLAFDPAALAKGEMKELRIIEKGAPTVYKGVPLRVLLSGQLEGGNTMTNLRDLVDAVILVRAEDDYQVAVSAAEVVLDEAGERFLLAFERDGKPLGEGQGPAKLVIPADTSPVRWIRQIKEVELVRMPRPRAKSKP